MAIGLIIIERTKWWTIECAQNFIISLSVKIEDERNFHVILASMEPLTFIQVLNIPHLPLCAWEVVRESVQNKFRWNHIIVKCCVKASEYYRALNGRVTNQKRRNSFWIPLVHGALSCDHRKKTKIIPKLDSRIFFSDFYVSGRILRWVMNRWVHIFEITVAQFLAIGRRRKKAKSHRCCFE